ncbi:MAG TPA: hypothetical protein VJT82_03280 [Pyrinomonadaceae bacterium]|nr:hypothetical protein [Pyrinomonadaceae bacterium]
MKTMLNNTLLTVVAGLLVLPFAAIALLAGERAMSAAASATHGNTLLVAFALVGAFAGAWRNLMKPSRY